MLYLGAHNRWGARTLAGSNQLNTGLSATLHQFQGPDSTIFTICKRYKQRLYVSKLSSGCYIWEQDCRFLNSIKNT